MPSPQDVLGKRYEIRRTATHPKTTDRRDDIEWVANHRQQVIASLGEAGLRYYAYEDIAMRKGQDLYVKEVSLLIVLNPLSSWQYVASV